LGLYKWATFRTSSIYLFQNVIISLIILNIMARKRHYSFDETYNKIKRHKRKLSESDTPASPDYQEISSHEGKLQKFSTNYHVTEFIVNHAISHPEEKLQEIFDHLIDKAYFKANLEGKQVDNPIIL
jgi:hypothetical protein